MLSSKPGGELPFSVLYDRAGEEGQDALRQTLLCGLRTRSHSSTQIDEAAAESPKS